MYRMELPFWYSEYLLEFRLSLLSRPTAVLYPNAYAPFSKNLRGTYRAELQSRNARCFSFKGSSDLYLLLYFRSHDCAFIVLGLRMNADEWMVRQL